MSPQGSYKGKLKKMIVLMDNLRKLIFFLLNIYQGTHKTTEVLKIGH